MTTLELLIDTLSHKPKINLEQIIHAFQQTHNTEEYLSLSCYAFAIALYYFKHKTGKLWVIYDSKTEAPLHSFYEDPNHKFYDANGMFHYKADLVNTGRFDDNGPVSFKKISDSEFKGSHGNSVELINSLVQDFEEIAEDLLNENVSTMDAPSLFKLMGCNSGNNKNRKPEEFIFYPLKDIQQDFEDDLLKNGIKKPIELKKNPNSLCIVDGYHRISTIYKLIQDKKISNFEIPVKII